MFRPFFAKIYCINLDSRPDKWEEFFEEARKNNISGFERFPGVVFGGEGAGLIERRAGCFLSHRDLIKRAKEKNIPSILCFEDDVLFLPGWEVHLKAALADLGTRPWDVFYLGLNAVETEKGILPLRRETPALLRVCSALTTHAIAYNHTIYDTILSGMPDRDGIVEWLKQKTSMDGWLATSVLKEHKAYCANEILATQRPNVSDIDLHEISYTQTLIDNFYKAREKA